MKIPKEVLGGWNLKGPAIRLGNGLINDTFRVDDCFVLQRVNSSVFTDPKATIDNHLKILAILPDLVPNLQPTIDGGHSLLDDEGHLWRLCDYYEGHTYEELPDSLCRTAGSAFGQFLTRTQTFELTLRPSIERFHNLGKYLEELEEFRSSQANSPEWKMIFETYYDMPNYAREIQTIHGDCKVNNLLFNSESSSVLRILDLDTVMYGHPAWDYGDLIRSVAAGSARTTQWREILETRIVQTTEGFFQEFTPRSNKLATSEYSLAPSYMSMMLGIRFLTDHYRGDQYFRVERHGDNLVRARQQLDLATKLRDMRVVIEEFVEPSVRGRASDMQDQSSTDCSRNRCD